jgi:hypothetical protein
MRGIFTFDRVINVALLAAVIYGVTATVGRQPAQPYKTGDRAPVLSGVSYGEADKTLVLFVASACHFCSESMPLYNALVSERNQSHKAIQIVAVSRDTKGTLEAYLAEHEFNADRIVTLAPGNWVSLRGTPTHVVVGRDGIIQAVWLGKLSTPNQSLLREALGLPSQPALTSGGLK